MMYTHEMEAQILHDYMPFIKSCVNRYLQKCKSWGKSNAVVGREDLVQIAAEWFLRSIRENGLTVTLYNRMDLMHELHEAIRQSYPIHIAPNAFAQYRRDIAEDKNDTDVDPVLIKPKCVDEQVASSVDAARMYAILTDKEKMIIELRMSGYRNVEIAKEVGLTPRMIRVIMTRIRSKCGEFLKYSAA